MIIRRQNRTLLLFLTALLLSVLPVACNWPESSGGDQRTPPQTTIINVWVHPETVTPSDTATFTCIIKDSTDTRFKFLWYVDSGKVIGAKYSDTYSGFVSDSNTIKWKAPQQLGIHSFDVYAFNGSKDSASVDQSFSIYVKE